MSYKKRRKNEESLVDMKGNEKFSSEVQQGLSPKQNKVNVVVSNKGFIKRSKVPEVTQTGSPHLWIVSLIPRNTTVASRQPLCSDATWHLKTSSLQWKVSWGRALRWICGSGWRGHPIIRILKHKSTHTHTGLSVFSSTDTHIDMYVYAACKHALAASPSPSAFFAKQKKIQKHV